MVWHWDSARRNAALPLNRSDVRSACVWAYVAYKLHLAGRHGGTPMTHAAFLRSLGVVRSVAARSSVGRDEVDRRVLVFATSSNGFVTVYPCVRPLRSDLCGLSPSGYVSCSLSYNKDTA